MADRDISEHVLGTWEGILKRHHVPHPYAVALELKAVLTGNGIRLVVPAHRHDPNADWHDTPQPGDHSRGAAAARAAIQPTRPHGPEAGD